MRLVQEHGFLSVGVLPVVDEVDAAAIRQGEARDVDRVAEGVLGEAGAGQSSIPRRL